MNIFKPHPASVANLVAVVEAHEHALALWGFLAITHQQLYGNASALTPALQAVVEASEREVDAVLAVSRRLDDLVEAFVARYFDDEESTEDERYEAVAWARGQMELDPEIGEHLRDFTAAQGSSAITVKRFDRSGLPVQGKADCESLACSERRASPEISLPHLGHVASFVHRLCGRAMMGLFRDRRE